MYRYTFFAFLILGCSSTEEKKIGETREGLPDAESWNATITLTNKGAKRAVIKSGHLEKYQQRQYILLDQNVDADFYNNQEIYTSNLKSDIAEIDEAKDFLIAVNIGRFKFIGIIFIVNLTNQIFILIIFIRIN